MAINSTSSTTNAGSSLDVASIVSQLMEIEKRPLTKLESKISQSEVKISALGQFQSKLSALKSALNDLQTPTNFSGLQAQLSRSGVAAITLGSTAQAGSYQLEVTRLAQPGIWNVSGFADTRAATTWFENSGLGSKAEATVLQTAPGAYVLSLKASHTGTEADFTVDSSTLESGQSATRYQTASDAQFSLNGVGFTRSTNTISDVLTGVTLELQAENEASPVTLNVTQAQLSARPQIEALVTAYNDLQSFYSSQTQASADAASRGVLNSDFAVSSAMRQILAGLMAPLSGLTGNALSGQNDMTLLGIKLQDNGQLALDEKLLAASTQLQARLAAGIRFGYDSGSSKDLVSRIGAMIEAGGLLKSRIDNEKTVQRDLSTRKSTLQDKLATIQARYTAQYAALDALLYKLNSTSDSLKSALDSLTASQNNN